MSQPLTELTLKSVLADTRKLLELTGSTKSYRILKFHCEWVLHTKMERGLVGELLEEFDSVWDGWITRHETIPPNFTQSLPDRIGFYGFERELREFLAKHGIHLSPSDSREVWLPIEKIYCDVVEDSCLRYNGKKHLKHINAAKVSTYKVAERHKEGDDLKAEDCLPLGLEWTFMMNDEPVFAFCIDFPSAAAVTKLAQGGKLITNTPHSTPH